MSETTLTEAHHAAVERAIDLMHRRLREHLAVADLMRAALLRKSHFCRIFRLVTGKSPKQYLIDLRIKTAQHLLRTTNLPIEKICRRVGYQRSDVFRTRFRKSTGVAPTAYRRLGAEAPELATETTDGANAP